MDLSERLRSVADEVSQGHRLADIGTDHGYIPIFLVQEGRIPWAIATDINEGPLIRARAHIEERGLSGRIAARQGDGLAAIEGDEVDSIVLAGMGGALIERILSHGLALLGEGKELICQPQSQPSKVRRWLHRNGYQILREAIVKEDGKFYLIIKAAPGEQAFSEKAFYRYGEFLLREGNPLMEEYLEKERDRDESILERLFCENSQAAKKRREEIWDRLSQTKKALETLRSASGRKGRINEVQRNH